MKTVPKSRHPKTRRADLRLKRDRRLSSMKPPHRSGSIESLPDYPPKRGGILLVGMCTIAAVAKTGHYFQGHYGKRVWKKLAKARLLENATFGEEDEAWALAGQGVTDLVKRAVRSNASLKRDEIAAGAESLRTKVRKWAPRAIVFAFKNAATAVLEVREVTPGPGPSCEGIPTFLLTGPYAKPEAAEAEAAQLAKL